MTAFKWIIFMILVVISFVPIVRLRVFNINKKYLYFKYLSIFVFIFSIVQWLWYVTDNSSLVYYLTLSVYPIIFILTSLLFISVLTYLKKNISPVILTILLSLLVVELILMATNGSHQLFIEVSPFGEYTYMDLIDVPHGIAFFIHTAICYFMLLVAVILILTKLTRDFRNDQDVLPVIILGTGITLGVGFNIYHVFYKALVIDPTYIALVILISMLYIVFYIRDISVIFKLNSNNFIIDNLREMYVICNHRDIVVDASDEFMTAFNINREEDIIFSDILKQIENKVVIYEDTESLNQEFDSSKRYLHMLRKNIKLPFFRQQGTFYLFYDETENQKYIKDIAFVKSHDLMTSLYNRNYFEEIKEKINNSNEEYCLIMFDLDGLKFYNDYLGHTTGDELLIKFAKIIKKVSDKYNLTAIRMGGDEFLLICLITDKKMPEKVISEITETTKVAETPYQILFSYGYAFKTNINENMEKVISIADNKMYIMKVQQESDKLKYQESIICKIKK